MAGNISFTEEEMEIDQELGHPRAYARLCQDRAMSPYSLGPPFTFTPYVLQPHEALRADELNQLFPVIDPKAKPTTKPKLFVSLLWKQLNHLGNAGFDPQILRVDHYGNVLYYHADSASPLAWDIDHWFPCSRGGLTVPSNLRILQRKVCKRKRNELEFLVPWWDLQLGISINQFLSIFASSNSDFRSRAFSLLFSGGESEELNGSQTVESHRFPQHFKESKEQVGLAPAAIVLSRRESHDASSALKALDFNRQLRPNCAIIASRKLKSSASKENEIPDIITNPYQAIVMARDSLKQREETAKMQFEVQRLDEEVNDLKRKNEEEKMAIQDLELVLIKRRRRAEKCRRLAESQCSYRIMLEKMIRDAMHQSVIYKEQVRLNQAAANALMARLEAQKAICDASEKDLHRKFKQRDEIEKQIRPEWEQARKRSRMDDTLGEERDNKSLLSLPGTRPRTPRSRMDDDLLEGRTEQSFLSLTEAKLRTPRLSMDNTFIEERYKKAVLSLEEHNKPITPVHKELRVFLEEEQKVSEAALSLKEERQQEEMDEEKKEPKKYIAGEKLECSKSVVVGEDQNLTEDNLQTIEIEDGGKKYNIRFPVRREPEIEEDEEIRKQRGKGNVEKWLQMLLENTPEDLEPQYVKDNKNKTCDLIRKINVKSPQREIKILNPDVKERVRKENEWKIVQDKDGGKMKEWIVDTEASKAVARRSNASEMSISGKKVGSSPSFEGKGKKEKSRRERGLVRSESARGFRPIPSSPSVILGMRKGVDCIMKKPLVMGDDEGDEDHPMGNNFVKSSIKTIKKAVRI